MNKEQTKTIIQITILFILPVVLIVFGIIPLQYRFFLLILVSLLVLTTMIREKWTLKDVGIRLDNIKNSTPFYTLLTTISVIAILFLANMLNNNTDSIIGNVHFQYAFLITSFLQELLFRSFLIPKLKILTNSPVVVIILNALLFGLIHVIFSNTLLIFVLTVLLGLGFAAIYYMRPNLILATIAHSIINFVAVYYCFANLSSTCK